MEDVIAVGIALVAIAFAATWVGLTARHRGRVGATRLAVAIAVWMVLTAGLAGAGVLARWDLRPPPLVPLVAVAVVAAIALGRSAAGGELARRSPLVWLIGLQALRLPLELVMARAATIGLMPVEMSVRGYNLDLLTGATALLVAALAARGRAPRWLLWAWNLGGIVTLLIVVGVAVAATPTFRAFGTAPTHLNTWIAAPPFVWLPTVIVPSAVAGHVVLTRRLLARAPDANAERVVLRR